MKKGKLLDMIIKKFVITVEEKDLVRTYIMDKYLVDLDEAFKKGKRKIETNLVDTSYPIDLTYLDVLYFFEDRELSQPTN